MSDTQGPYEVWTQYYSDGKTDPTYSIKGPTIDQFQRDCRFKVEREAQDMADLANAAYSRGAVKGLDEVLDFLCNTANAEAPKTSSATLDWIMMEVNVLKQMHAGSLPGQAARGTTR